MRKKGLELSINFIIVLILAIVTIAMGIVIFNVIFRSGTELEKEVSQSTKDQINRLLMSGDEPAILPEFFKSAKIGEQVAFGLGIRNFMSAQQSFTVHVEFDLAVDKDNADKTQQVIASGGVADWYFQAIGPVAIPPNGVEVVSVPIRVRSNAKSGYIYVFNVRVSDSNNQAHGNLQKIYVKII
jgi:hypothetical protein